MARRPDALPAILVSVWLFASRTGHAADPESRPEPEANALMKEFTSAFKGVEKSLAQGDPVLLREQASRLGRAAPRVRDMAASFEETKRASVVDFGERMGGLASEVEGLGENGDWEAAAHAFEEIRATCAACHLKFRRQNPETGLFPARGNTVHGEIQILKVDGRERTDRSGVVVFLDGLQGAPSFAPPRRRPVISQKDRQFSPRVLPILRGTTVDFPNDDTIFHNVFSLCEACPFDLGIYEPGESKPLPFEKTGLVRIYCNIHPDMVAAILVLSNPFFTVTDPDGFFAITGVPEGIYSLRTWHEFGRESRREVSLSGDAAHAHSLQVKEDRGTIPHKNKFGKPYREAYR